MDATWSGIVIAVIGSSAVTAVVTSWLNGRRDTATEMRERRLQSYPAVWTSTSLFSTWPRTSADSSTLELLHGELRRWYFGDGGLYLSENARARYGELQQLISRVLSDGKPVDDAVYGDVMAQASAFRTSLTDDLRSRAQRSLSVTGNEFTNVDLRPLEVAHPWQRSWPRGLRIDFCAEKAQSREIGLPWLS